MKRWVLLLVLVLIECTTKSYVREQLSPPTIVNAQDNTNPYCGPGNVVQYADGVMDGPASKPTRCMFTRMSSTPSSNHPKYVGPKDSLAAALATAAPGDNIVWDETSSLSVGGGGLTLPNGTAGKWITIRTSSSLLPDEFTRITPTFEAHMPKILFTASNATVKGGQFVRLIGIELTRPSGTGVVYNMVNPSAGVNAHDLIFDRIWFKGTAGDETNRGLFLSNVSNVTVMNSYFTDMHCMALVGSCGDAQGIGGGTSSLPDGNFKFINNHIEASGENILLGGGPGSLVTCDVLVAYNEFTKPMSWNPWDASYAPVKGKDGLPHPWIVKNLFELKNGCRVLLEGNRMSNTWGGFTQVGAGVLFTPKNSNTTLNPAGCPVCAVTDVIARYNTIYYVGQGFQIGYGPSGLGGWPADAGRYSIHDNDVEHIQYKQCYGCGSYDIEIAASYSQGSPSNLHDVLYAQNTHGNDGWFVYGQTGASTNAQAALTVSAPLPGVTPQTKNINFVNNVIDPGAFGAYSTGGKGNCWSGNGTLAVLFTTCWPGGSFTGNTITTSSLAWKGRSPWPTGNGTNPNAGANMAKIAQMQSRMH